MQKPTKLINVKGEHWEMVDNVTGKVICSGDTRHECLQTYEEIMFERIEAAQIEGINATLLSFDKDGEPTIEEA